MLSRPACPGLDVPGDLQECIYRCFEAHRQRVLERRAARHTRKIKQHQSEHQQSFHTEQYQNLPPQPLEPPSNYSNLYQESEQYQNLPPQPPSNYSDQYQKSQEYQNLPPQPPSHYSNLYQESQQYQTLPPEPSQPPSSYSDLYQESQQYQNLPPQPVEPPSHYTNLIQESHQYQNFLPQPSVSSSDYSNLIQESKQYQQLLEPIDTTIPTETFQQSTFEHSNVDQSTSVPTDTRYQAHITSTQEPYHHLKEVQYTSPEVTPSFNNAYEQTQISSESNQSQGNYIQQSETTAYTNENTQYQAPVSQVFDSNISDQRLDGSSIPTGTVEYTRQSYYSEEPILNNVDTGSYFQQIQSSDNQQYVDNNIPPPAVVPAFDLNNYTNEQTTSQQQTLPLYEENQQHIHQETIFNKPPPSPPSSDSGSDRDAREDEEIFDLRACICRCYAKFKETWNKDQQVRYQQQFRDIKPPFVQISDKQFHQIDQRIPTPVPTYTQPPIPPTISRFQPPTPVPTYIQPPIQPTIPHFQPPIPVSTYIEPQIQPTIPRFQPPIPVSTYTEPPIQPTIPRFQPPTPVPTYIQPPISPAVPYFQPPIPVPTYTEPPIQPTIPRFQPPTPVPTYIQPPISPAVPYFQPPIPVPTYTEPPIQPTISRFQPPTPVPKYIQPPISPAIPHFQPPIPVPTYTQPPIQPTISHFQPPTPIPTYIQPPISPAIPHFQPPIPVPTYTQPPIQPTISHFQPPTPIPTYIQPPISPAIHHFQPPTPTSIPPCTQQIIQQSNTFLSVHCDHKEPEQHFQTIEVGYVDATTQTRSIHSPIQPYIPPQTYEQPPDIPQTIPIDIPEQPQIIDYHPPIIPETPQIVPRLPTPVPQQRIVYNPVIPPLQPRYPTPIPPPQIPSTPTPFRGRPCEASQIVPRVDAKTGLCLVPCPESVRYAHLPPHLRPSLFCVEIPPEGCLPPVPPPLPPPPPTPILPPPAVAQAQRWCVKCCCVPGKSLIKKITYRQIEDEKQHEEESYIDYASIIDQLETKITVRYGNSIMEEGDVFVSGNYNEQLRITDFPVYVSGKDDPNLIRLVAQD